jgi:hypothetical protein
MRKSEASGVGICNQHCAANLGRTESRISNLFSLSHQRGEAGQLAVQSIADTNSNAKSPALLLVKQNTTEMSGETAYELIFNLIPHQVGAAVLRENGTHTI